MKLELSKDSPSHRITAAAQFELNRSKPRRAPGLVGCEVPLVSGEQRHWGDAAKTQVEAIMFS